MFVVFRWVLGVNELSVVVAIHVRHVGGSHPELHGLRRPVLFWLLKLKLIVVLVEVALKPAEVISNIVVFLIVTLELLLLAHELDHVWLEGFVEAFAQFSVDIANQVLIIALNILLTVVLVLKRYAIAIEQEHPLVDLEIFDVQLRHQLNNLDSFEGKHQVTFLPLRRIKDLNQFIQKMWPEFSKSIFQFGGSQSKHHDARKQEKLLLHVLILVLVLKTLSHLLQ